MVWRKYSNGGQLILHKYPVKSRAWDENFFIKSGGFQALPYVLYWSHRRKAPMEGWEENQSLIACMSTMVQCVWSYSEVNQRRDTQVLPDLIWQTQSLQAKFFAAYKTTTLYNRVKNSYYDVWSPASSIYNSCESQPSWWGWSFLILCQCSPGECV